MGGLVMSIAGINSSARISLTLLLYKSGRRQVPTLTTASETWANSGSAFPMMYEQASLASQGAFDYQAGAGYAFDLWVLPTQTINAGDRIVVASDSMTFEVLEASIVGAPGPLKRLRSRLVVA